MLGALIPILLQGLAYSAAGAAGDIAVRQAWKEFSDDVEKQIDSPQILPGYDVRWLQESLGLEPDGIYGRKTINAVKKFQTENGLEVDGWAGIQTIAAIERRNQEDKES